MVEVISCRHTVLSIVNQWNVVEDFAKDFSVASEVTSGIEHHVTWLYKEEGQFSR